MCQLPIFSQTWQYGLSADFKSGVQVPQNDENFAAIQAIFDRIERGWSWRSELFYDNLLSWSHSATKVSFRCSSAGVHLDLTLLIWSMVAYFWLGKTTAGHSQAHGEPVEVPETTGESHTTVLPTQDHLHFGSRIRLWTFSPTQTYREQLLSCEDGLCWLWGSLVPAVRFGVPQSKCDHDRVFILSTSIIENIAPIEFIFGRHSELGGIKIRYLLHHHIFDISIPSTLISPWKPIQITRKCLFLVPNFRDFSTFAKKEAFCCENKPNQRKLQLAAVILVPVSTSNSQWPLRTVRWKMQMCFRLWSRSDPPGNVSKC